MAKLDFPNFQKHLSAFDFTKLFTEVLGWNNAPLDVAWQADKAGETDFTRRTVAELGGVVAIQVVVSAQEGSWPDEAQRMRIWKHIARSHAENLIIFTEQQKRPIQSQWYWVKRSKDMVTGKPKLTPRRHEYFAGQPVDLFASKLQAMVVELSELDATGRLPVLEAARRIQAALDVDKTTKKFFTAYQQQHLELLGHIKGIDNERDKRWYASVLLNRLMFVWFMQKKFFLDGGNADYLQTKLAASQQNGQNQADGRFFGEFLNALFFEAFAKPEVDRSKAARALTGQIPYLNGGLFLHHKLELDLQGQPRVGTTLTVADAAFEGIFNLFASFTWHLDDTPGGDSDEINPDVLGYIFEKYINQKAFGAYYTRPEITGYLAERSIHKLILEKINKYGGAIPQAGLKEVRFCTVPDLLARMDTQTALKLVKVVLPSITILDPAVGSGAFLVAALKTLINVYYAVVGRAEMGASADLQAWLKDIKKDHASVGYYIKRRIVTDNLHGVDIMEEACEIAKLRLFLAMVSSVRKVEDLEPLPNIDFNILPGNSLVGLMRVDEVDFNQKNTQMGLFADSKPRPFAELLVAKNRLLDTYRHNADMAHGPHTDLRGIRDDIDKEMRDANAVMNELMRDQFEKLDVKFEQATWDAGKKQLGKPKKRPIERADIDAQTPFHWGYVFDDIVQRRGGFDIILANPPWEVFKPQAKEFFAEYSGLVSKNKMTIKEFEKEQAKLLQNAEVREAWLAYESRFPHMSGWFRAAPEFKHQSAVVGGKKTGSDINLYKLFVERSFHLLRPGGHCGIVIPSGIYTDLGAKGLRDLLFGQTQIEGLFCFENRKTIFEGVDSRFKFVVLTFEKVAAPRLQTLGETNASAPPNDLLSGLAVVAAAGSTGTTRFPAAFMRHEIEELSRFPGEGALWLDVALITDLSPDSYAVMEFKSEIDLSIVQKLFRFPRVKEVEKIGLSVKFVNEFHMTNDSSLFSTTQLADSLPLYEGSLFWQFNGSYASPRYFLRAADVKKHLPIRSETGQWQTHHDLKLALRLIASTTNERTLIAAVIPANVVSNHNVGIVVTHGLSDRPQIAMLYLMALFNSFVLDWLIRIEGATYIKLSSLYRLPIPKFGAVGAPLQSLATRAARLICTTPEFDDLAKAVGLKPLAGAGSSPHPNPLPGGEGTRHKYGTTDPTERAKIRAELDGLVAHLYGLTEEEFAHVLSTFPLVAEAVKVDARNAYRRVANQMIQ